MYIVGSGGLQWAPVGLARHAIVVLCFTCPNWACRGFPKREIRYLWISIHIPPSLFLSPRQLLSPGLYRWGIRIHDFPWGIDARHSMVVLVAAHFRELFMGCLAYDSRENP